MATITHRRSARFIQLDRHGDDVAPLHHVLVVVPIGCEGTRIVSTLARVRCAFPGADVLVVDDHSSEGTASYATRLGEHLGRITVTERRDGSDPAWEFGARYGAEHGYDIVVELHENHSVVQPARRGRCATSEKLAIETCTLRDGHRDRRVGTGNR